MSAFGSEAQRAAAGTAPGFSGARLIQTLTRPHMVALVWLAAIFHIAALLAQLPSRVNRFDFSVFYASAVAMREGLNPYMTDLSRVGDRLHLEIVPLIHTTSTPTFLVCFEPFAWLPLHTAYWVWFAITVAALAAAIVLLLHARDSALSRPLKLILAAMMLLYAPLGDHLAYAQAQILILLLLVLMMRSLAYGRDAAAGVMLAIASALRAFPFVLVIYLLLKRRWRALAFTAIGLFAIEAVTFAFTGRAIMLGFWHFLISGSVDIHDHAVTLPINVAVNAFITRLYWYVFGMGFGPGINRLREMTIVVVQLAILGLSVRATLATPPNRDPDGRAFGLWVVVAVMLSPVVWLHYWVLLFIPFTQIAIAAGRGRCTASIVWMITASYFLIPLSIGLRDPAGRLGGPLGFTLVAEAAFVALLLAFVAADRFALSAPAAEYSESSALPPAKSPPNAESANPVARRA